MARRDHAFPTGVKPALVVTAKRISLPREETVENGVRVVTIEDIRWQRCDIKSVSLLPNVLGKQHARENGAYEAWQIDQDGNVTEGTSSNSWIVTHDDRLLTRPATHEILNGITRQTILKLAAERGLTFEERAFSLDEALAAREAFISSAISSFVTPVTQIDDTTLGNGRAGSFTMDLRSAYFDYMAAPRRHEWPARGGRFRLGQHACRQLGSFTIVMNATYAHFDMPGRTQEEYRKVAARSAREVFPAIFGDRADEARDVFYAAFTRHHLDAITTMPGAAELLAHLQDRAVTLAVVSNKMGDFLRREAAHLGWAPRFIA